MSYISNKGVTISEPSSGNKAAQTIVPQQLQKDKGKGKMFIKDSIIPDSAPSNLEFQTAPLITPSPSLPVKIPVEVPAELSPPITLEKKSVHQKHASTQVDEKMLLSPEASNYLVHSVMNLVDKPIASDELMELDAVMLEWALYEEVSGNINLPSPSV